METLWFFRGKARASTRVADCRFAFRPMTGSCTISALLSLLALFVANSAMADGDFVEDAAFLRVTISGRPVRLEALIVKRASATGRLPIALITHGKPTTQGRM